MKSSLLATLDYNKSISEPLGVLNEPLLSNYGLSFLTYRRFSDTGELLYIFNNHEWMEYSFQQSCWISSSFSERIKQLTKQKFLNYVWPEFPNSNDPTYHALYEQNIWNGIIMYRKYDDCIESFAFASTKENRMLKNFYADGINVLNKYILYFKDKAHSLIYPKDKKIFIPYTLNLSTNSNISDEKINNFFKQTKISKYFLMIKGRDIIISKREMECLSLLSKGKRAKEISSLLNLSPRTIEFYLNNVKIKSEANLNELIEAFLKTSFIANHLHNPKEKDHES
ncbi:MAG: helix-turn-helix transcriptional regulator [Alphaproteobacteria bacterium]|nr:helix-turn-helix transcriptional regulator [Alphaproteobacteria bacterium]MBP7729474.1 helix-turn-helix transcriptional regulator [Alphaproteobacteria bacterium]MDP3444082.1 helix-turn-helix transcriptional regulator [Ignavibacteria bacterium]